MSTVRTALAQAPPHVSLKLAWKRCLQLLRVARRTGRNVHLSSRSDIERLLDMPLQHNMNIEHLKESLRQAMQLESESEQTDAAMIVDAWARQWLPSITSSPVHVRIDGWPTWVSAEARQAISGHETEAFSCLPDHAAWLQHHLHGLNIGGQTLRVGVDLPEGHTLPTIARSERSRKRQRGGTGWLPYRDEEGRTSLTPQSIAAEHGNLLALAGKPVIDAFCGLGGNAVAAALAGCSVHAVEIDPVRMQLARSNAEHFGVASQITFHCGDARTTVPALLESHGEASVFLDPPWGGVDWDRRAMTYETLFGPFQTLMSAVHKQSMVMLKLPRTFDIATLPQPRSSWNFHLGLLGDQKSPADRANIISAYTCTIDD